MKHGKGMSSIILGLYYGQATSPLNWQERRIGNLPERMKFGLDMSHACRYHNGGEKR